MMLIAGKGNDVQDLSISEVTVNSPTTIPTSRSPTTSSAAMPSSSTAATSSRVDRQGKKGYRKQNKCYHQLLMN